MVYSSIRTLHRRTTALEVETPDSIKSVKSNEQQGEVSHWQHAASTEVCISPHLSFLNMIWQCIVPSWERVPF